MSAEENPSPQQLRDWWCHAYREHMKAMILTECARALSGVVDRAIASGNESVVPDFGDALLASEALHEALDMLIDTERVLSRLRTQAYAAFTAAVQQN
jgi:hypothetical protein